MPSAPLLQRLIALNDKALPWRLAHVGAPRTHIPGSFTEPAKLKVGHLGQPGAKLIHVDISSSLGVQLIMAASFDAAGGADTRQHTSVSLERLKGSGADSARRAGLAQPPVESLA
jgi:hypothetical protein